jgi:nitrogen fixation/metabolism regulation signal transduction histidine kinase
MKKETVKKLINRLDHLDYSEVQAFLLKLSEQKGFFQQVFEVLKEGVILLDAHGNLVYVNKAAARILNKDVRDITADDLGNLLGSEYSWNNISRDHGAISHDAEIHYPEHLYLNLYIAPIGEKGSSGYLILIRDETSRYLRTEEILEAEKLNSLTLLAAGVAHEIGNPLNSIGLHLQLLERKLAQGADQEALSELVKTSRTEVARLDAILRQFLQAVRPSKPQREAIELNPLIEEIVNLLRPEIEQRNIQIHLDATDVIPVMAMDPVQMKQVFYNLIRNAYQAIPAEEGGSILIQTALNAYEIRVTISDTGSGVSPEVMGCLYEPFMTTKSSGTGLGLLIVRRIVKDHGGNMTIASNKGKGTTITLFFPRTDASARLLESPESK